MISEKRFRPGFFIENQHTGKNPHDTLPPEKSRDIIIAHAEDGAKLLKNIKCHKKLLISRDNIMEQVY